MPPAASSNDPERAGGRISSGLITRPNRFDSGARHSRFPEVQGYSFADFIDLLRREWEPGQHMAIIAPTGEGKTTMLVSILTETGRKWVVAVDPKGGDSTLNALGWRRVRALPRPKHQTADWWKPWVPDPFERMAAGEPFRAILGRVCWTTEDLTRLQGELRRSLRDVYNQGGWTVAIDEFQIASDPRMMDLRSEVDKLLIAARDKGVSVVTLFQAPRWVSPAAHQQSKWVCVALTKDKDLVERLSEILGRSRAEIQGAIDGLGSRPFSWLIARNNPRQPLIVTRPPRITRKPVRTI